MASDLPAAARAVVIGGGVGGASTAYHLARLGWRDVVVLEQHDLTDGTTWHSAGFVGQLRSTITQTRLIVYSRGLYAELREQTGLDPGWHGVGGLRLATTPRRVEELERQASAATTYELDLELLSPAEAQAMLPILAVDDVLAAAWLPGDGWLDPAALARALATGAEQLGVAFHTHTTVTGIDVRDGRVRGVTTDRGAIAAETVVICAGAASAHVGALAGVTIPVVPMLHQFVRSHPLDPAVPDDAPTVRDPDHIVYFRPEDGGLLAGGYSRAPQPYEPDGVPLAEPRTLYDPDRERLDEWFGPGAVHRVPAVGEAGIREVVHGPEAFTPDGEFIVGEAGVEGLWVGAGFCVHGLAGAGGVGKTLAEWIVDGQPEWDVSGMDARRFGRQHASRTYRRARALEAYAKYYDVVLPGEETRAGRPLRTSPTYPRALALDAAFGEKSGWERVNWFAANAPGGDEALRPRGWAGVHWSPAIRAECLAARDAAALFDQSSFSKIEVHGPGAAEGIARLCANRVDREPGVAVYTQLLNPRGGVEADLTVTRVAEDRFRVVTGTAFGTRDRHWLRRHLPPEVGVEDVTSREACLCLWGPLAREVLHPLADADLSDAAFPFLRARSLHVGPVPVFAQRITFVGELGWELYCPVEYGLALWDLLAAHDAVTPGGYRAIDSMRLEKGYRVWGLDVTPETTPHEAGLSFAVRNPGDFIGREALLAAEEPETRLRCLVLDDPLTVCLGSEPVRVAGQPSGRVTSGGYGNRVDRSIAYAYLPAAVSEGERVEVGVFDEWVGAEVVPEPLYDPAGERIRPRPAAARR